MYIVSDKYSSNTILKKIETELHEFIYLGFILLFVIGGVITLIVNFLVKKKEPVSLSLVCSEIELQLQSLC